MKLSCAFMLTLTNLVIVSPFSFSVKGSGTSANAGATAVPATFGLVHNVPSKANGYSGNPPSPGSIGFTSRSESSSFGAFNYNSGQVHGSSEYIAPGEVGHNVATALQAVVTAAVHANAESLANIKASGSYSPNKINNFSTNSASHFQYQPTTFESKPSSPFNVGQSTSINSHEHSKHVLITSKQSEKSDKFNQPSEVQSLPCQTFNSGPVIAEKSPVYNRGFGGPSGILTPDNKATYIGSSSLSIQQSTTESVKPLIQSLNNEYNEPLDTDVSVKPELKPTASIKPLNNEKTKKDHFVTSSQHGQDSYIKDKNTLSSLGAKVPSTNEYSNEKVPANNFNGSKPIQNFQLFVQPYNGNVLPSSDNNIQNEKTFVSTNNPAKIEQTKEITYTGGFGAPTGVLKPFSQLQSSSHTFVSSEKLEQYETSKTNKVTTTETKESIVTTSSKKPLNEINVNDTPSTESTTYQLHENDSPADSYVTQKLTSPVYDESDSPVLSTSKTHSNFFQLEHKEINEASQQPENNTFNPIVTSWVQGPTPSSSFSKVPVSYTIEKQVYVNSLDTKSAVSNSYDKLKPEKTEILISNQNKPVYTPIAATKLTPVSSWEQSSNNIPIKSNFENTQPSKFSVTPKTFQSKYPLESGYTVAKVKQEISGESYSSELNPSTPVSATVVSTLLSGKPQFNDFLLFTTTKPPTASVNGANQYLVTSSAGFSSTSSEYSESHKISSTSDHTLAVINGQSEKAQKIPNKVINDFTYPTASVASLVNSGPIQSVHQSIPNLSISSTNTGTASVQSTLGTIAQQSSFEASHEYVAPTASSVLKISENPKVWSSDNALSIDYNSSSQKSNDVPNPTASVASQGNSNLIQSQNQFNPNLSISSTNVGTSSLDSTLVAFAQQSSYKPSQEYAAPTAGSIPKVSESRKVWSTKNPSSIDYGSSTQKPNNFANPSASVAPQGNSNPIQSQNQFKPSLPISSTNIGTSPLDSTLVAFAQQSFYKPSQEYAAPTTGSIPKVSESPKVWSTKNSSSIDYSSSTQKPNNFANPTASVAPQGNSNPIQSQNQFKPSLPISSTNVGTSPLDSTLVAFAQQSSYKPSQEYAAPTAGSIPKVSESRKVWSTKNPSSIDYGSSTQKPNNFANPSASVAPQGNSNPIQSQNQFKPSLPISSTNIGTSPLDSTLVAFAQQSFYKPSQEYAAPTTGSIPKVSESPKVWSTKNSSSIDYSSSTQKPNNFANPTASVAPQGNSNPIQSQNQFKPSLPISSTNVGTSPLDSTLVAFAQQSSYKPSQEYAAPTAGSIPKVSESPQVWLSKNPSSIGYSSSTQKPNNFANPTATFASQTNSNSAQSQHKFNPNLSLSSTNVGSAYVQSTLATFAQQSSYDPSHEYVAPTASSVSKTSENSNVWSSGNALSIDYSSSTQKSNNVPNPSASVGSQGNSNPIQNPNQFNPNLSISSTNVGTSPLDSTLVAFAQQSSYKPSQEYAAPTAGSIPKVSESSKVWSTENPSSIGYSSSTQKPNNFANPTATFASQTNSNSVQSQDKFNPNLSLSSTNVGSAYVQSTLATFAQQSSYDPSHEYVAPTASSVSKTSENSNVWSSGNALSIDYSSSTQKSNNFPNPSASVGSQGNSNPIQNQNQFNPNLSISSTNVGTSPLDSTLVAFAQQSSYKPSQEYAAPTAGSIPKVSESSKVWSTENPSSIGYSSSTQKPNNFANPTATFASQTNSNSVQSQDKFNPNLSLSSTNVGSAYVQSTLATFAQQSSYDPSHEYVAPTASSVSKTSENSNVWSSGNALSIDYSSSTQKSNNVPNPSASVGSQGNSNPIQNQNQFNPNLSISSTNVGTSSLDSTLVAFTQQSSYKPSQEYAAPTAGSIPKVSESPKVWSTENPSSIGYSSSTQRPNNFANPTATFASQTNSNFVQSQHKFNPNLSLSSTNVGSAYVQSNLATFAQQSTYEPAIENSSIDSVVPKVSENIEVFPENPSFNDNNSSTQKPNSLTYSGTSSNSYIKEFELQSSTAPTVGNGTPNKPLYSNTFGTLTGAVKPSGYSHSIVNSFPSSISNSNYDPGLVSVSNVKLGQSNYFSQYKPALSGFKEKSTTLSSLYPTDSIYVSTAKPYVTPASSNIAQQSTELNQKISKFSSSLHSATKPTQGPKQQLNNNVVSTVSLLTPSTIKPTSPTVSYSAVFPTSGPVFVAGSSQSKPQYQYSTVQPATQKKQWYTNTLETFGGVKPQSSYTYPGFTSSFSNFGYGSSIVANKQFTRVPLTGQYKQPSTGQYNPISTGLYKPTSTGQYYPSSTGQYYPTSTGQYYPTSTGQYNPTLTNQYKPYNWGFSRQPATLKPSGQIAPAGDLISTADAPKSSTSLEKSKFNYGFSILNQKETGFASGFSSPSVSHTTLKPISSIEEYSGNQKITPFISTTPKTNTQKPWFIVSQATTHGATNQLETSDSVTSQFFNGEKPTVAPYSVVPSPNPPSNILPSSEKPVEYFYINNSEPVSDIPKHTSQLSYDKKDNNSFEQISSTTPKIVGLIKPTSSVNFVVQTSSSLSAGSENTKNSQLTTSNYGSQQTLNQNNIQIDSSLSTTSLGQETNSPKTEFLSNGISSVDYDTSSPKPSSVPFFTNLNFPFTKPSNAPHKSEYTSVSGVSTVVFEPPKKLSESIVPNYSSAVSTENNYYIISDKEEVKDQVTSINGFQHNPLVFSNSFNSVIPSKPSAKPGQNIPSKPQDQSIVSPKDSLLAEDQGKLDINVKPTNLHSSSTIQLSGSIYNSSNQQKPTATVSSPAQSEDARTVYQKPLSQHSSLFHSGTTQLSKPNIKITVINPPSSSTVYSQYVGSFGGPSGLLKPNDFSGPFVQAIDPSQKNLSHQNQPALDINSGIKVTEHPKLGSYSGGFGGPPGVLKPDNSEIHTGVFYAGQDKQSPNVETSGLHGSLTIHNLSPSAPSVGSYADIKKQNVYSPFIPTKPNKAVSTNSEGLANSKVESYNQQHSGIVHDSGNTKSTSSFSGQFGKVNSLTTIASVEASAEAGAGPFGLKRAFTSGLYSTHSSGPIANTDHGSKIF